MNRTWLRALGEDHLPETLEIAGALYRCRRMFKHDFFAVTGLYQGSSDNVVLKVGRCAPILGVPMAWIGRFLARRETRLFRLLERVDGVPKLVGLWGTTGFIHAYVEGRPLRKNDPIDDRFFPRLAALLDDLHRRGVAYCDLEKRENILVGEDGRPYLIDFQISWHVPDNRLGNTWIARRILSLLQESDRYHLLKHWRRLRPDQLSPDEIARSHRPPIWIVGHRLVFRPLTHLRRRLLVRLGERKSHKVRAPG